MLPVYTALGGPRGTDSNKAYIPPAKTYDVTDSPGLNAFVGFYCRAAVGVGPYIVN